MGDVDSSTILPNLIVGCVAVAVGVLIVLFRRSAYRSIVARSKPSFVRVAERVNRGRGPFWVGFAGAGGVLVGAVMLVWGFAGLSQLAS
ncbi:hypothetical protein FHX49_000604 [Microbacterium endophyticum]|uniref:Uncharacterized protein n=1 Tax=Microbacterium endophyticum TaxID=1526412 RepID=A0A7W4V2P7_9MICO|nr:hypothetical protein [Microbacterium endophyticum]NIK37397.1 hypothetical protein [Microbacterium endophyticum]